MLIEETIHYLKIMGKINEIHEFLKKEILVEEFNKLVQRYRNNSNFNIDLLYNEAKVYDNTLILSLVVVNEKYRNKGIYTEKDGDYLMELILQKK